MLQKIRPARADFLFVEKKINRRLKMFLASGCRCAVDLSELRLPISNREALTY